MKTIRFVPPAACMLAGLMALVAPGDARAESSGRARVSDFGTSAEAQQTDGELIIRGASQLRRRNAQTSAALRRLFRDHKVQQAAMTRRPGAPSGVRPVSGCLADSCCPPTCAAPCDCCPPGCDCGPGACHCQPSCQCGPGACCCPSGEACCPPTCGCPIDAGQCCPGSCDGCDSVGHIRISDACAQCGGQGCPACGMNYCQTGSCRSGSCRDCRSCESGPCLNRNCLADFLGTQAAAHRARNRLASANLNQYLRCKLGYFIHDGNGGVGSPLFGHYSVVYPVDPGYADGRDGQVYAAQGYGGAVSVPLAPVVRHTYNYGWGIPSSRLTPVSNTMVP